MEHTIEMAKISTYIQNMFSNPHLKPANGLLWEELVNPIKDYVKSLKNYMKSNHIETMMWLNYTHNVRYTFEYGYSQILGDCLYVVGKTTDEYLYKNRSVVISHIN